MAAGVAESWKDHPVVLFDGECALCNGSVTFLLKADRSDVFRFTQLQSDTGRGILERAGLSGNALGSVVLAERGGVFVRSAAVLRILRRLGFPFSLGLVLLLIPAKLRDAAYDSIARNRYRWFGRHETCRLLKPEERHKFI